MRLLLFIGISVWMGVTLALAEGTGIEDTVIRDRFLDNPIQYREEPLGFREKPPGHSLTPLGFRSTPFGFRETLYGFRDTIPNTLEEPRGFSVNPPRFIEREEHPQANNDEKLKLEPKTNEQTAISDRFSNNPPGYKDVN